MKKEDKDNSFLDMLSSILVVLVVFAVAWYFISEWIDHVKNPQTRVATIITTIVTIVLMVLIYNNPDIVRSLLKSLQNL